MLAHLSPKERLGYACLVGLLLFTFGFLGARHLRQPAPIVFQNAPSHSEGASHSAAQGITSSVNSPSSGESSFVVVHVVGAVANPGVVRLDDGSRVIDAVHAAGGPAANADLEAINLAARLVDGSQLRIPTKQQTASQQQGPTTRNPRVTQGIDKSGAFTPVVIEPEYLPQATANATKPQTSPTSSADNASGEWTKKSVGEVDVNTATVDELRSLPGVGPSTAQKIIDYRQQHGPFKSADDLDDVPGIGPKKLEKMRAYVKT